MKILFIITSWDFGGAEIQVMQLTKELKKRNHNVLVVSLIDANKDFLTKARGIKHYSLGMKRGVPDFRGIIRLKKIIKAFQPDIVHAHMIHAVVMSRITKIFIEIPRLISTAHNIWEGGIISNLMYRYTDFLSDINTNVSKTGTERYIKDKLFSPKKTYFIPNGIAITNRKNYLLKKSTNSDFKSKFKIEDNRTVGIAVGRFSEAKDYFNLIKSVSILSKKRNDFIILIAGDGELRSLIEKRIEQYKLQSYIKLLGRRNDIIYLMENADFFVMSSAWEGLPIVILEAASVGLPAVVTNVGGNNEIIENNKNGYLVPPKNSLKLSKSIDNIISLPIDKKIKMGNYSRNKIMKEYEMNNIVNKWIEIYNKKIHKNNFL